MSEVPLHRSRPPVQTTGTEKRDSRPRRGQVETPGSASRGLTVKTIHKLTVRVCGTNPSTLERERARVHHISEPTQTGTALGNMLTAARSLSITDALQLARVLTAADAMTGAGGGSVLHAAQQPDAAGPSPADRAGCRVYHHPPEVNYGAVLTFGEIKQEVHLRSVPRRGNRRLREARYSSLEVAGGSVPTTALSNTLALVG
jgi:hypothetical protein